MNQIIALSLLLLLSVNIIIDTATADYDDDDVESKEFADQMHKEVAYIYVEQLEHRLAHWLKVKLESNVNGLTPDDEQIFKQVYAHLMHMRKRIGERR